MRFQRFVVVASVLVVMAISAVQPSSSAAVDAALMAQSPTKLAVGTDITRVREQWVSDLHDKRLESITALYEPDAVFVSDGSGRVTGRLAIHDLCQGAMASLTSSMHLHSVRLEGAGNLAYDSGDYDETTVSMSDGTRRNLNGSYLMVFRRQADGKWLIVEQWWTETGK